MNKFTLLLLAAMAISCAKDNTLKLENLLDPESSDLKPNALVGPNKLESQSVDTFRLNLDKGAFVYGYAEQHDVDVIVKIFSPSNQEVASFDDPARGPEHYKFTTDTTGVYKMTITPFEKQTGTYSIILIGAERLATTPEGIVEQQVRALLGEGETPGVAVAVQRDGKLVFNKGFGYADIEQHVKITPTTVFHVASVSKQFTAFAIAMLADQGKLNVNDDIRKYLPEMHDFGKTITINHLVHHTSGLRDQWSLLTMAGWRMDDVITTNQVLRLMNRQRELNFEPGAEYTYCNSGFTLMAEIVHRVTGETFPEWCRKNMFEPLGMKKTLFFDDHELVVPDRAYSYQIGSRGFRKSVLSYANAGATSLFTTVEDISLWSENFEKMKVGNANVMNMMNQKFVLNHGDTIKYAFGQSIDEYKGLTTYNHGGADAGFRTYLLRIPEQHFSVAVFSNGSSFPVGNLTYQLVDAFLEKELKPAPKKAETPPQNQSQQQSTFDPSKVKLKDYTGTFYSPELETNYTFEVVNDTLVAHHQRHDDMKLRAVNTDVFNINILGTLQFYKDKGKISGFRASNGRVRNLKFEKVK